MKFEIKYVQPSSLVFSALPVVLFFMGCVAGMLTFVIVPNAAVEAMTAMEKMLAVGIYSLFYMIVLLIVTLLSLLVYNFLCSGLSLRGVIFEVEAVDGVSAVEPEPKA